jgi:WD40 repeat protein
MEINKRSFKKPHFELRQVKSDGSEKIGLYSLRRIIEQADEINMGRRDFLSLAALVGATALIASCTAIPPPDFIHEVIENNGNDGELIVAQYLDKNIRAHTNEVKSICFGPKGKILASGGSDNMIKLWDVISGIPVKTLEGHTSEVNSVCFSPDGILLASGSRDNTIKLWDVKSGKLFKTLEGHKSEVNYVCFSPDGILLASGSRDNTIKLWDVISGKPTKTLEGHTSEVNSVCFSPDGMFLASGSRDKKIKLWDIMSGKHIKTLKGHGTEINDICFSPDGKILASGSRDNTIKFWDIASSQPIKTLKSRTSNLSLLNINIKPINSICFSPDGKFLASSCKDGYIKLWDATSGKILKTLKGHTNGVNSICFSPDGRFLASGSMDNTIKIWNTQDFKSTQTTCLFDPAATEEGYEANIYRYTDDYGISRTYTLPCGAPIPNRAICTCNCVPGTYSISSKALKGYPYYEDKVCKCEDIRRSDEKVCKCDLVQTCECVPVCTCMAVRF